MKSFRQYCEERDERDLLMSLVPRPLVAQRERLSKMVYAAYKRGDHEAAERLDARLEELDERIESMLQDMDDGDATEDRGEEQRDIDLDWSVQDEFARIYDRYARGDLHLAGEEWEEADPSYKDDPEFQRLQKTQGYAMAPKGAFRQTPITKQKALADMLRGAVWESPNLSASRPRADFIRAMPDEQIIDAARDAWEWKKGLLGRIRKA